MILMPRYVKQAAADEAILRRSVDGARFRRALSRLAAAVSIVTTADQYGCKPGLTATPVTPVSLDPALVCIDNHSRTVALLMAGAPFVVHFLAAGQEELARRCATFMVDKFAGLDYSPVMARCSADRSTRLKDASRASSSRPYRPGPR